MRARERRAFEAFTTAVVAPAPPLPPVEQTDAARAFAATLAASPRLHRAGLRALLLLGGARLAAVKPLRALAQLHYYGDDAVMRRLGYDADEVVARAAAAAHRGEGVAAGGRP
ncbi:MAG: hypothetical protein HZB46_07145 [Solirubrobacterales bacterium]|nr:hypothetical protein [Solirubrobacterales bacterium]